MLCFVHSIKDFLIINTILLQLKYSVQLAGSRHYTSPCLYLLVQYYVQEHFIYIYKK